MHPVFQEQLRAKAEDHATVFGKLGSGSGCMKYLIILLNFSQVDGLDLQKV
jgi:hypothetical protein